MCTLSSKLQNLKIDRNLLQKDIAKENNLSLRDYQYYEKGERNPTSDILIKLADYFNVSVDLYLMKNG